MRSHKSHRAFSGVDDSEAFRQAVHGLVEEPARLTALSRSARELAVERFRFDSHEVAHERLYERVVAES